MDYSKLKVTDLKAELKKRGIPQTGLKLKQNLIDRLVEADAEQQAGANAQAPAEVEERADVNVGQNKEPNEQAQPVVAEPEPQPSERKQVASEPEQDTEIANAPEVPSANEKAEPEKVAPEAPPSVANEPTNEPVTPAPTEKGPESTSKTADDESRASLDRPSQTTVGTGESTPALSTAEGVDDSKKRKRRSQSPPPSPATIAQKKAKAEDGTPRVMLKDDAVRDISPVREARAGDKTDTAPAQDVEMTGAAEPQTTSFEQPQVAEDKEAGPTKDEKREAESAPAAGEETKTRRESEKEAPSKPIGNDARFKGLFPTASNEQPKISSPPRELANEEDEGRAVAPALHPATSSLYIRDFMRPLQPGNVKNYLTSLATPPKSSPNPESVLDFFLDSIRTHCFATFPNISAASRVRSALHGAVWPQERSRKPLWVDFVPEDKVKEWIRTEQDSESRGRGAPRWEVVYDEDNDNNITATLQEAGAARKPSARPGDLHNMAGVPSGPRAGVGGNGDRGRGSDAPPTGPSRQHQGTGFQALDDRFLSTSAKPKLYFLPVSREVSDQRLDRFSDLARRGPLPRPGGDEMRRYTFENTDSFVDKGPEYGQRSARGGRGRRGGGGFGDRNWRGRGY
ncbi:hypothetical protein FQN54_007578 [Arachnomyces sp. PD_36]|nr:hypothetical protein FQN54_007578 [Arachnomyces sp. PD_36]